MSFYQFQVPTKIIASPGISKDFAHECELMGVSKLFVVTDQALVGLGLVDPILEALKEAGVRIMGTFSDVPPDSSVKTVELCAAQAKASGAEAFLAIGGGSVMDTAKGANILFSLGGDLKEDYSGAQTITEDLAKLIAVPTTAGTGSEVTEAIVIRDEESDLKLSFVDHHLLPSLAVLDAELTLGLPPLLTAATGMDALTHAMEAMMSVQRGPLTDALALKAISLVHKNLVVAVKDGQNIDAREAMMTASNLAGMAFNHSMVGVVHAVAHVLGAVAHVHHGAANAIFLPYGLEYNLPEVTPEIASMHVSLGLSAEGVENQAQAVIQEVKRLLSELNELCGLPIDLKSVKIKQEDLEKIADMAVEDGASFYNPRPVESQELLPLLNAVF